MSKVVIQPEQKSDEVMKPIFQVISQELKLPISLIEYDGMKIMFYKPYSFAVRIENEMLIHENRDLSIFVGESSLDELVESFFDAFCYQWRDLARSDNSKLGKCAIEVKERLLAMAKEVTI